MDKFNDDFFKSLNSQNTRKSYQNDLTQFSDYISKTLLEATREDIVNYRNHLMEIGGRNGEPSAPYTIARKLSAIKSYFKFECEINNLEHNPFINISVPTRSAKNEREVLSIDEIEDMIAQTASSKAGVLHAAIIALNFYAVVRLNEFLTAKVKDFTSDGILFFLKVKTKGGKFQRKEIPAPAAERILAYLDWLKETKRDMHIENYLFRPTRNNHQGTINIDKPLNPSTINRVIKKYAKAAGILKNISSHSGRASAITNYLTLTEEINNVADIYGAKTLAGHSKISTTEIYDKKRRDQECLGKISKLYKL